MSPLLVLAVAPFALALVVVGLRRPVELVLPAYALTVPFGSGLPTGLPGPYGSLSSVLGLLLLVGLAINVAMGHSAGVRFPATVPVWLGFLGLVGASALWSVSPQLTQGAFLNLAVLVVLYVLLALTPVTPAALVRVEVALVAGGAAAASYGLIQLLLLGGLPTSVDGGERFGRDLLGANNTAAALLLPLAVALVRSVDWPRPLGRMAYRVAAALIITGVLMTGSRGGLIATAATVVVALFAVQRRRLLLAGYVAVAALALGFVLSTNPAGIGARTASTDSSGRTDIWRIGLAACETYCVTGSGWGTFPRVYQMTQPRVPEARVLVRGTNYEPHSIWILIGVEAGAGGVVLAIIGFAITIKDTVRLPGTLRGPPLAGLAGTLTAGFFLSNFEYKFFWMALMYALICRNVAMSDLGRRTGTPRPVLANPS